MEGHLLYQLILYSGYIVSVEQCLHVGQFSVLDLDLLLHLLISMLQLLIDLRLVHDIVLIALIENIQSLAILVDAVLGAEELQAGFVWHLVEALCLILERHLHDNIFPMLFDIAAERAQT